MEVTAFQPYPLDLQLQYYRSLVLFPFYSQENYVHWTETPESHIFSADIPGVRKEEIQVEVDDSIYLIIRTDPRVDSTRSFARKFRLPSRVDMEGISAGYQDGVLTVTVPKSLVFGGLLLYLSDLPGSSTSELTARAA